MIQIGTDELNRQLGGSVASMITTNTTRPLLGSKLQDLSNDSNNHCLSQLESLTGKSFDQIKSAADSIQYYDMSTPAARLMMSDLGVTNISNQNLTTYFFAGPDAPTALTIPGTQFVLLGSQYFTGQALLGSATIPIATTDAFKQDTLFHELWHTLGVGDLGGSGAFDNWLQGGCNGPPPGAP